MPLKPGHYPYPPLASQNGKPRVLIELPAPFRPTDAQHATKVMRSPLDRQGFDPGHVVSFLTHGLGNRLAVVLGLVQLKQGGIPVELCLPSQRNALVPLLQGIARLPQDLMETSMEAGAEIPQELRAQIALTAERARQLLDHDPTPGELTTFAAWLNAIRFSCFDPLQALQPHLPGPHLDQLPPEAHRPLEEHYGIRMYGAPAES